MYIKIERSGGFPWCLYKKAHNIRNNVTLGMPYVQVILRLSLRMDVIQKSFEETGHYPYYLRTIPYDEVDQIEQYMEEPNKKDNYLCLS